LRRQPAEKANLKRFLFRRVSRFLSRSGRRFGPTRSKPRELQESDGEADDGYAEPEIVIEDRIVLASPFQQSDQRCTDDQMHQNAAATDCGRPVSKAKRGSQVDESSERTGECQQDDPSRNYRPLPYGARVAAAERPPTVPCDDDHTSSHQRRRSGETRE
jgi:hypothetical protein